jgi:hypothetical protein
MMFSCCWRVVSFAKGRLGARVAEQDRGQPFFLLFNQSEPQQFGFYVA